VIVEVSTKRSIEVTLSFRACAKIVSPGERLKTKFDKPIVALAVVTRTFCSVRGSETAFIAIKNLTGKEKSTLQDAK
jgi:hypothetical protein